MNFMPRRRRKPEIIIVSLIDIFAILLIFMVMNTEFKEEMKEKPQVTIKLPESKSAVASENVARPVVLSISEDEEIFLGSKKIALNELGMALAGMLKETPPPRLALSVDRKAPFGVMIKVLDALKEAGVEGNLSAFTEKMLK